MNYPPLQTFNDNDEPIGQASLREIHDQGLLHRVILVVLRDPDGKILLQRRGPNVATNANRWDVSAAGHVDAGEHYKEAATRELSEELGVDNVELSELAYYRTYAVLKGKKLNRFVKIYTATVPADTRFTINPEEVIEVKWFDPDELKVLVSKNPENFNNDFEDVLDKVTGRKT
ncbi:MAG TPA: NUDIX domain-containing protein [Candidatus Saccharimonadales bacterium]